MKSCCSCLSDIALDLSSSSSSVFSGYVTDGWMQQRMEKGGGGGGRSYGSLSDTPSIITLPPPLSPPQRASPFHSLSLSRPPPLRTISAQDLEKSFLWDHLCVLCVCARCGFDSQLYAALMCLMNVWEGNLIVFDFLCLAKFMWNDMAVFCKHWRKTCNLLIILSKVCILYQEKHGLL